VKDDDMKKADKYTDTERSVELVVMISPRAERPLSSLAGRREMSREALAREYLSRGMMEDRLRAFADSAFSDVEEVLREQSPENADALISEVRRRFAETF
jgi:hypothetical protein